MIGAAKGIGASRPPLREAGATVICVDVRGPAPDGPAGDITADGGTASAIGLDVSDRARVQEVFGGAAPLNG